MGEIFWKVQCHQTAVLSPFCLREALELTRSSLCKRIYAVLHPGTWVPIKLHPLYTHLTHQTFHWLKEVDHTILLVVKAAFSLLRCYVFAILGSLLP